MVNVKQLTEYAREGIRRAIGYCKRTLPNSSGSSLEQRQFEHGSFREEKKKKTRNLYPLGDLDSDLHDLVWHLNELPFAYTLFPSCSGSPKDHNGHYSSPYQWANNQGGFVYLKVDTGHRLFEDFRKGLIKKFGIDLFHDAVKELSHGHNQEGSNMRIAVIRAVVPKEVLDANHPEHKAYLSNLWTRINQNVLKSVIKSRLEGERDVYEIQKPWGYSYRDGIRHYKLEQEDSKGKSADHQLIAKLRSQSKSPRSGFVRGEDGKY